MNEVTRVSISTGTIIRAILIVILFFALFYLKTLVLVVVTAIIIASAVEPVTLWLGKYKIPRVIGAGSVYVLVALILAGVVYFVLPKLTKESFTVFNSLHTYVETLKVEKGAEQESLSVSQSIIQSISKALPTPDSFQKDIAPISAISGQFFLTASSVFGGVVSFLVIIVLSFYLAVQKDGIENFLRLITPARDEKYVVDLWKRAQIKMGLWLQGQLLLTVIIGGLTYIGLLLFGVRDALILAILTGLMELIPLFGPIIAAIPAFAVGYLDGGWYLAVMVLGLFVLIHQLENHVIYPLVVRKIVGVNPVVVIVALLAGFELGGFLGMLVSVPLAAVGIEFLKDMRKGREIIA